MASVYLSPSVQVHNAYAAGNTNESVQMNRIADVVETELKRHGVTVYRNRPTMNIAQIAADSNKYKVDAHLAIHSNAGGGRGTEIWASKPGIGGDRLAQAIYKYLAPATASPDRGVKYNMAYIENTSVNAPSCIAEVEFHDSAALATWIINNVNPLGVAIAKGILAFLGIAYKEVAVEVNYKDLYEKTLQQSQTNAANATRFEGLYNAANAQALKYQQSLKQIKEFIGGISI